MLTRRELILGMAGAGALLALDPQAVLADPTGLITRAIPRTNERLPIVGLGSSATFAQVASSEDVTALRAVLGKMVELGGTVFDTAPAYGASEEVAGQHRAGAGDREDAVLGDEAQRRATGRRLGGSGCRAPAAGNLLPADRQAGDRPRPGAQHGRPAHPASDPPGIQGERAAFATSA